MFVGHLAVAFGGKRVERTVPLSWLVAATFGLDLLWPLFLLAGIEHVRVDVGNTAFTHLAFEHYPWSHSLAMAAVWGGLAGFAAAKALHSRHAGMLVGAVVVSHWVLDLITHRADLPLWPSGPLVGLGLWYSIPATFAVEGTLFAVAVALYVRFAVSRGLLGHLVFWGLIAFVSAIWIALPWTPPPPDQSAVAVGGFALWIFPLWAAWIERTRTPSQPVGRLGR